MDGAWLVRARWRYRGAWLWPMFAVLSLVDGLVGHSLPVSGRQQSMAGGVVVGLAVNLLAVVLLSRPLGAVLRRRRRDLPTVVARNYAGTFCLALITAGFVVAGLANRSDIRSDDAAYRDAVVRAVAYIGDRAPAQFRRDAPHADTFTIQPGSIYRTCVPNSAHTRTYCVIVRRALPFARSVVFDGYEPNSVFAAGVNQSHAIVLAPGHLTVLRTIDIRAVLDGARELRERLTARQREVLTLVARGATNAQIAERLSISEKTVGKHLEHVYETLGVVNRTAAAARWLAAPT